MFIFGVIIIIIIIIIIITIIIIHSFYIALFSALEQTHCVHVACDPEGRLLPLFAGQDTSQ